MSAAAYAAAAVCLFFIGFFGFFTNLVVIVLMCREKQLWTPLNVILFNLVLSDFSVSILGNPFTLASALAHRWLFGRLMCIVYGFFMSLLGISSITTLTVLSFERYLMISKPFRGKHLNHKGSAFLVISIWIYSLALTTPPLFGWGEYINESANISCSVNWETSNYNHTTYIVYLFAMGLFVPASVICFSYLNIIRSMKKNVRVGGHVTKAEKKVAMMVAIMIVAFFFAWTPYAILALLIAFADAQVAPWLSVVPALMAKSSICYNPIIYVVLNTQAKRAGSLVHEIMDDDHPEEVVKELDLFSTLLLHRCPHVDAFGFFQVDYKILLSIVSVIAPGVIFFAEVISDNYSARMKWSSNNNTVT
ncbi:vertebrate ancient opsin-like [Nilaparvata lugens]|uniref:vertebrate ancient opsin-like n=1 Tax=Nilaparvata lugens TaxID=108931 RepID=UPI00193D3AEA|nr:vertebrate ancient opsin-like [Nilaparvata lugens]